MQPLAVILMGSASDMDHAEQIAAGLKDFGIAYELRVASAHKVPALALEILAA